MHSLLRKPANSTGMKSNGRGPLLISQHFNVSQSGSVVDGEMHLLVPNATGTALPSIASDPVANTIESGLFCVHMNHVTRLLPLVADDWFFGLQIFESAQSQPVYHTANSRQGRLECLGVPAE